MDNFKINLDREKVSSEYIQSKQDFNNVLHHVKAVKPPVWKSPWFYGPIGVATVAALITFSFSSSKSDQDNLSQQTTTNKEILVENAFAGIFIANKSGANDTSIENQTEETAPIEETNLKVVESVERTNVLESHIEIVDLPEPVDEEFVPAEVENEFEKPEVEVNKPLNMMPNINGVYTGEIPLSIFCGNKLSVNKEMEITSFTIHYEGSFQDQTVNVNGNEIPRNICLDIESKQLDQMIFVTNIFGKDSKGKTHTFTSMNFVVNANE